MDDTTTLLELKEIVRKFCEARDWNQYHNAKDLSIGIITEASELLEHFRFKSADEIELMFHDQKKRGAISEELADILYFLLRLCQRYDIDLTSALDKKMELNEEKYSVNKAKGSNKKYNEF